ncbi:unnamed protein product [Rotaria sp. Silwood1]|nr:unnamed protein product [Rotaria sp. Silwood1]CAF1395586.1 unnamed protein product [Rotaria sp. Silwood1]
MLYMINFRWSFLHFILWQLNFEHAEAAWPSSNVSTIQLLGLFPDASNTSKPTTLSVHSEAMFKAAILLSQQFNITIDGKYIGWKVVQTTGNRMGGLSSTCREIPNSNIVGIVGPAYSREAEVIAEFGASINIPVISYSATNPDLSDRSTYPTFYRTVSSDSAAALAMVELFTRYNWSSCIIIYQNDAFGSGGAKVIKEAFNDNGFKVSQMVIFDIISLSIRGDLQTILLTSASRIVIIWAIVDYTNLILQNALEADVLGPRFTWILSSSVVFSSFNVTSQEKLIGILTVEPVTGSVANAPINNVLLNAAYDIWQQYESESFPEITKVDYYALFAFDATWSFIQALQQYCSKISNNSPSCISIADSSFCFDRYFINGDKFINTLSATVFLGVSGLVQFSVNVTDRKYGIYYVAKNVQYVTDGIEAIPVLVWSNSNSWTKYTHTSVILWPGNTLIPPTDYPSISNVKLKIGVFEVHPFTMTQNIIDNSGQNYKKIIGFIPDLIDLLVNRMGFIPQITVVPENSTYNSLVDAVVNGVFDIVVADLTVTSARSERVSFSSSIFDNSLRVITRKRLTDSTDLMAFLKPLSVKLWMVLLAATICTGFLICLYERKDNEALQNRSIIGSIAMSIWYSFGNVVGYGVDFDVRTAAGRLITASLYMLSLVIIATYTANLASDLMVLKTKDIISGIDDIKNGKLSYSRVGIVINSSIEDYYLREISGGIRNFYSLMTEKHIYTSLLNNIIDVAIMDSGVLEYATSTIYCNLTLVGTDFDRSIFGIAMPKQWLYEEALDFNILSLRESGELDNLRIKWFQGSACSDSPDVSTSMSIESTSGLFIIFIILLILSLLLYIWEKRHYREIIFVH